MNGTAWIIHRADTPRICHGSAMRGRFRWGGLYWDGSQWGAVELARYYTTAERDGMTLPDGGRWIECLVAVTATH